MTRAFFDTNVLVYLFDSDEPEKKARAQECFEEAAATDRIVLSTQVLQEFYWVVTRKLATPLPPEVAEERVRDLSRLSLVQVSATTILAAVARSRCMGFSFWDALILEAALAGGADRLLTEDLQHGQDVDGLRVENPFL